MESWIGRWVQRRGQAQHLVESEITDRLVMRCGRQMRLRTARGDLLVTYGAIGRCRQCLGSRKA